jgi:type IV secretory pathway VirB2 component (pilin)
MNRTILLQDAFSIIEKLAAICATPGINDDTQKIANQQIQQLLDGPIGKSVAELKIAASGIVTLNS